MTSVAARTPSASARYGGIAVERAIERVAAATAVGGAAPALSAVAIMPVPSGLVSTSTSPGRAAALVSIRSGRRGR